MQRLVLALMAVTLAAVMAFAPAAVAQDARIELKPSRGPVGTEVTVRGEFTPLVDEFASEEGPVLITFDGVTVAIANPNARGEFTATFTVPQRKPGTFLVEACFETGARRATAKFVVVGFNPQPDPPG